MVDEFSTRLRELLDYLNITPVSLAEKMGVQRTSFNHLLSGRNKPGFEFLTRLHSCYPEVNLNWLISGYGAITDNHDPKISYTEKNEPETHIEVDLFSNIFAKANIPDIQAEMVKEAPVIAEEPAPSTTKSDTGSIDRLIIVYSNGKIEEIK